MAAWGIYIHLPFCLRRCAYCDFVSYARPSRKVVRRYLDSLKKEIDLAAHFWPATSPERPVTVYIGGGTPTFLATQDLAKLLVHLRQRLFLPTVQPPTGPASMTSLFNPKPATGGLSISPMDMAQPCATGAPVIEEITIEANPGTLDPEKILVLKEAGVSRWSLGVQSFDDGLLAAMGRTHTAREAIEAFRQLREADAANVGLDLIYGLPGQSLGQWQSTLRAAIDLGPEHISIYGLGLDGPSRWARAFKRGELALPDENTSLGMFWAAVQTLTQHGYHHYEIANYARPGYESRHNLLYWHNRPYWGLGAGAASSWEGDIGTGGPGSWRWSNLASLTRYCESLEANRLPVADRQPVTVRERMEETMFLGLRLLDGVSCSDFTHRFGVGPEDVFGEAIAELLDGGLLERAGDRLRLTQLALPVANEVFCRFV